RTKAQTAVSVGSHVDCANILLKDGETLLLGDKKITVLTTPGHTDSCVSYVFEGMVFTGDALLIRGCGRTDFQQGSSEVLFKSVREKLFTLPEETTVYPGHDYRGFTSSTIAEEKQYNPRLAVHINSEKFVKIMSELKLDLPKKIHAAVPANMACGKKSVS
ncbi:MAG: MBL fold metallo-hydrolase, partial [Pseudobdellovibrio sp.]